MDVGIIVKMGHMASREPWGMNIKALISGPDACQKTDPENKPSPEKQFCHKQCSQDSKAEEGQYQVCMRKDISGQDPCNHGQDYRDKWGNQKV